MDTIINLSIINWNLQLIKYKTNMTIQFRNLILRYGVFALLGLMSAGILFFVCSFELRVKTPIHLFYDNHGDYWHGYLANQKKVPFQVHDTLSVVQTSIGDISCIVENITFEPMGHRTKRILRVGRKRHQTY